MFHLTYTTITHVPVAAVLVLNTPDDGRLRPKHVEWPCRNKTCTVLHQVCVPFDLFGNLFRSWVPKGRKSYFYRSVIFFSIRCANLTMLSELRMYNIVLYRDEWTGNWRECGTKILWVKLLVWHLTGVKLIQLLSQARIRSGSLPNTNLRHHSSFNFGWSNTVLFKYP